MMKRFFCMLLVAAMLLSFMPAVSLQAAATGVTSAVGITVANLTPGTAVPEKPVVTVEEGGTLKEAAWGVPGEDPTTDTVFEDGERYFMTVRLTAPEGTVFDTETLDIYIISDQWREYSKHYDNDLTELILEIGVEAGWEYVDEVQLDGLPEEFAAGAAQTPSVEVLEGEVAVTNVRWVDADKQAVTQFADGNVYFLEITLKPNAGYELDKWTGVSVNYRWNEEQYCREDGSLVLYFRYSLKKTVGEVFVDTATLSQGMDFADLTATVTGDATLASIQVYDQGNNELTEGTFQANSNYRIFYTLQPKTGYEFSYDTTSLEYNRGEGVTWDLDAEHLYFNVYFTTCAQIETVEMSLSAIGPGVRVGDVTLEVSEDAPYVLDYYYFEDENWETLEEDDTFQLGQRYYLRYYLSPKENYVFSENVEGYINGEYATVWADGFRTSSHGSRYISFEVEEIRLDGMPYEIEAGTPEIPEIWESAGEVKITEVTWVDQEKQPVTAFREGKVYYLAISLEPMGTRSFGQEPEVWMDSTGATTTFEKLTDKKAVIYIRYSLEPAVEAVQVTVTGVEAGKPVDGITVTVNGNATLADVVVMEYISLSEDSYTTEPVDSGVFEAGKFYQIECYLQPGEGYRFTYETEFTVNGEAFGNWGERGEQCMLAITMDTCQKIDTAKLTMADIKVGKSFSDLQAKVPSGANYTAITYWYDGTNGWEEATGKVKDGHRYEARVVLTAKDGYVFAKDATATLNGAPFDIYSEQPHNYVWGWIEKNFQTPITKVELPAKPASIQKNQELPTLTVSSSKNYTLTTYWGIMGGDGVTEATEDGIYVLVYTAEPKAGYTFTDDTKFYIGGKEARPLESGWSDAQFLFNYNIGIPEITRVDFLCQELQMGQEPPQVTVSDDAAYTLEGVIWLQGATDDWTIAGTADTLTAGLYTYVYGMVEAADGMALDEQVEFYLGGQKMEPAAIYNFGQYAIALFELGKLGEVEKLKAPTLTVEDKTVSWNAVLNATGYEVYRATSKSGKYTKVATVETTTFTDDVAAGKTYYYKVKAVYAADSSKNSGFSSVVSIVYKCEAPVITVTAGDSGKPVISWEQVSGAKQYTVYRATSETGKYTKLGTTKSLSYTDSKAAVGTTYYYKVIANASKSTYSSDYSNVVNCYAVCGTPKVTVKLATASGKPVLSWSKISGAVGYEVYLLGAEDYVPLGMVTGTSFTDESCYAGEGRYYGVRALGSQESCNSEVSQPVFARANCAQPKLQGSVDSLGKPVVSWQEIEGAASYEIYRSTKSTKGYTLLQTVETTSYTDETVTPGKAYYYKVVAVGENCKSAESAYVKLTGKCAVPTITVVNGSTGKPVVSWEKIAGAKKYTVYRATSVDGKYTSLGSTTKLTYTDTKAKSGTEYFYKIIANGSSKSYNSGYSNICMCYVICGTPSVSVKVNAATGKPSLSWKKQEGAVQYVIYRQLPGEDGFSVIAEQTAVTFEDATAPIDTVCNYRVQALGAHEMLNGAYSEIVTATSGIAQPKLDAGINSLGQPRFNWQLIEGAVKYEIYRSTKSTKGYTLLATVEDGNAYADESATPGKTYYYKVVAVGENSRSTESAYVKLTGKCAAPWISIALHETSGKPVISWEKINGAKQYTVYRATSEEGKYTKLGTTKSLSYTDSKAVPGTQYFYKVVANGSKSSYNSNYSNVKTAVGYAAQPQVTLKNDSKGRPIVSWKKISEAEKYFVVYVDITDVENEEQITEQFILDNLQYVEVSKKKTSVTLTQAQTGRIYLVCVVAMPKNEEFFAISEPGFVAATCAAPKISGKYIQGYNCGTWKAVEGAEYYAIYRSTKASGEYVLLGYIDNDSSFVDLSAVKGKTYYYKVTACTEYTESDFSNYIKLKTK